MSMKVFDRQQICILKKVCSIYKPEYSVSWGKLVAIINEAYEANKNEVSIDTEEYTLDLLHDRVLWRYKNLEKKNDLLVELAADILDYTPMERKYLVKHYEFRGYIESAVKVNTRSEGIRYVKLSGKCGGRIAENFTYVRGYHLFEAIELGTFSTSPYYPARRYYNYKSYTVKVYDERLEREDNGGFYLRISDAYPNSKKNPMK